MLIISTKKLVRSYIPSAYFSRAGVEQRNILKVYLTTIRPVLEYAVPIWQAIPDYLSERIESIQTRALRIIFPSIDNYNEAMMMAQIPTLESRRELLCKKYMTKMKKEGHPLHFMLPKHKMSECRYGLRNGQVGKTILFYLRTQLNAELQDLNNFLLLNIFNVYT